MGWTAAVLVVTGYADAADWKTVQIPFRLPDVSRKTRYRSSGTTAQVPAAVEIHDGGSISAAAAEEAGGMDGLNSIPPPWDFSVLAYLTGTL